MPKRGPSRPGQEEVASRAAERCGMAGIECVGDSQSDVSSSDGETPVVFHAGAAQLAQDSDENGSELEDSDEMEDDGPGGAILRLTRPSGGSLVAGSSKKAEIAFKRFDLGRSFDANVADQIGHLARANDIISKGPGQASDEADSVEGEVQRDYAANLALFQGNLRASAKLDPQAVQVIVSEKISNRYRDWYVFTEGSTVSGEYKDLWELLRSFGVPEDKLAVDFILNDAIVTQYDTYCDLLPNDYIIDEFDRLLRQEATARGTDSLGDAFRWFVFLILDRNIYDSMECQSHQLQELFLWFQDKLDLTLLAMVERYFTFVQTDRMQYFMLFRLLRQLPLLQESLMYHLFQSKGSGSKEETEKNITQEFNRLFDSHDYKSLLYFITFIYGSSVVPFGPANKMTVYFKDCLLDIASDSSMDTELTMMIGLLDLFKKICD